MLMENMLVATNKKFPARCRAGKHPSTRSRSRTGTGVTPLVFETNASTNSAIRANRLRFGRAKIGRNPDFPSN